MFADTQQTTSDFWRLIVAGLFAILPVVFFVRGLKGGPRSRRCANISLGLGLLVFVMPEITIGFGEGTRSATFMWSGGVRLAVGVVGLALGGVALYTRRDGGTGVARPVIGIGFSLFHVTSAVGLMIVGNAVRPPVPTSPGESSSEWVYQPKHATYRLTLPSADWKEIPPIGGAGEVSFFRAFPQTHCTVWPPLGDVSEVDFENAVAQFRRSTEGGPPVLRAPRHRNGTNAAGHRYYYFTAVETGPEGQPLFSAMSLTWCAEKRVVVKLFLEGLVRMKTATGHVVELEAMEAAAERILLSVE